MATWAEFIRDPRPLTEAQSEILEIIKAGGKLSSKQNKIAGDLHKRNRVCFDDGAFKVFEPDPELAYLPNAFVMGADNETPPVERLRNRRDPGLFRLIADLYRSHLADDGGIAKTVLLRAYNKTVEAHIGPFKIAKFSATGKTTAYTSHPILAPHCPEKPDGSRDASLLWTRLEALENAGLLEWTPTLFEASDPQAEPLFPLGIGGGASLEDRLGSMAHMTAAGLLARYWNLDHIPANIEAQMALCT
jgi:hypothetical protein